MGRISSRYNYRISKSKTKKKENKKKLLPVKDVVIRNKKTESSPKKEVTVKPRQARKNDTQKNRTRDISKRDTNPRGAKGEVTLENFKDYCSSKRVLLVGNAKDIIVNPYGSQIDSYDIVIRMNHGHPISKYAPNMGKKYNIWSHGFFSHKFQLKEYNSIKRIIDFHIETNEKKLYKGIFDKKAFLIPNRWYKTDYEKRNNGKEMSTGLNTAFFFVKWVKTMSEISIVGFDFLKSSNRVLRSASARKFHNSDAEESEMVALLLGSGKYIPFNEKYDFAK